MEYKIKLLQKPDEEFLVIIPVDGSKLSMAVESWRFMEFLKKGRYPDITLDQFMNAGDSQKSSIINDYILKISIREVYRAKPLEALECFDHGLSNHLSMGLAKEGISDGVRESFLRYKNMSQN